jgi:hypothetical protein
MVKTIFDAKTGKLLGAHMVGAEVTELIQGYVVAMNLETTEEELMHTIFPHPTLSETMHEACSTPMARRSTSERGSGPSEGPHCGPGSRRPRDRRRDGQGPAAAGDIHAWRILRGLAAVACIGRRIPLDRV